MKVFVHYPKSEEDFAILMNNVAKVHAQSAISYIEQSDYPYSQKIKLAAAVERALENKPE